MNSFRNILQTKLTKTGQVKPEMDEKTLQFLFERIIQVEYGAQGKSNVLVMRFEKNILVLGVYKSLWQAEITLIKEELREKLNKEIGSELIKAIQIVRK